MNSDLASLLWACCEEPNEDLPRMVVADWYEENGEYTRAEFVRMSQQQGREELLIYKREKIVRAAEELGIYKDGTVIWHKNEVEWVTNPNMHFVYYRGLPYAWYVRSCQQFLNEFREVLSVHPIQRVIMVHRGGGNIYLLASPEDLLPYSMANRELWAMLSGKRTVQGDPGLSGDWWEEVSTYPDGGVAGEDLEACMLRYGRQVLGLPPLFQWSAGKSLLEDVPIQGG